MEEILSGAGSSPAGAADSRHKVVVILGATGAGKSRLAIDLAQHFPAEILNADSMQVYEGLDILTNKVPVEERKGVPHHLLGTINSNVSFTSKDFRDMAIPIIDSIISRKCLPIIVGGTNYYVQALVSSYLVDDVMEDGDEELKTSQRPFSVCSDAGSANEPHKRCNGEVRNTSNPFDQLKEIDPIAANRLHPNDVRKINRYLDIFEMTGILPSKLFQGEKSKKWGRADSFKYDCCFLWVDASLTVLDKYVEHRVDSMIEAGLLEEVSSFYDPKADYTHGLQQAIGVREFKDFFSAFPPGSKLALFSGREVTSCRPNADILSDYYGTDTVTPSEVSNQEIAKLDKGSHKILLDAAIERMKANTCKLVRKQKRRLNRLKTFFGWNLHQLDSTPALEIYSSESNELWEKMVVNTSVDLVKRFLSESACAAISDGKVETKVDSVHPKQTQAQARDLWTQYVCEACGDRVLRGAHEWEQHKLGRSHRRQILRFKKKFYDSRNNLQV